MSEVKIREVVEAVKAAFCLQGIDFDVGLLRGLHEPVKWDSTMRCAIRAMREPTEEMLRVGAGMFVGLDKPEVEEVWKAMVDEALR